MAVTYNNYVFERNYPCEKNEVELHGEEYFIQPEDCELPQSS